MTFNKIRKRLNSLALITFMTTFLAGCVQYDKAGNPTGLLYDLLVKPLSQFMIYIAETFNGNYVIAIVIITVVMRLLLFPLQQKQIQGTLRQQAFMKELQPYTEDIQRRQKEATTQEEKLATSQELQDLYKLNNFNPLSGLGCLPLLLQMPIISAMYSVVRSTPEIHESHFMGVSLGDQNIPLAIVAGLVYLAQAYVSMLGMPEDQRKQMRSSLLMSPIMILMISWSGPAALSIYWIVGGVLAVLQSLWQNTYLKPKVIAEVAKEIEANPIKVPNRTNVARKNVTRDVNPTSTKKLPQTKSSSRNKGKQNR